MSSAAVIIQLLVILACGVHRNARARPADHQPTASPGERPPVCEPRAASDRRLLPVQLRSTCGSSYRSAAVKLPPPPPPGSLESSTLQ